MKHTETIKTLLSEEKILEVLKSNDLDIRKKHRSEGDYWIMRTNVVKDKNSPEGYRLVQEKYFSLSFQNGYIKISARTGYNLWCLKAEIMDYLGINYNLHHEQKENLSIVGKEKTF
tara:strand:+ start:1563 stop:1910 length:348 start_codon:yes stop_codon:yes gene_type:complete